VSLTACATDDDMRTVTAAEAEERYGIPRGSVYGWRKTRGLIPAGTLTDGTHLYREAHIQALAAGTTRRAPHVRPNRHRALDR
jgi:hypothetical protein